MARKHRMTPEALERRIAELQTQPLVLLCKARDGKVRSMSVSECLESGSSYIHLGFDRLDRLLARELG